MLETPHRPKKEHVSRYYGAVAVIGIRIESAQIPKRIIKTRAFDHDLPENVNFDAITGQPLWHIETVDQFSFDPCRHPDTYIAIEGISYFPTGYANDEFILGVGAEADGCRGHYVDFVPITDLAYCKAVADRLKEALEPRGLWCPKAFGLYAVLQIH